MMTFGHWRFWYHNDSDLLEPRGPRWDDDEAIATAVRPALHAAVAAGENASKTVRAAACIALGRCAGTPADVEVLQELAAGERDLLVQESAVLALGLLARSGAQARFDAALLDAVRADLLAILKDAEHRHGRARAFAAVALGLLVDQPSRSAATVRAQAIRLFSLLEEEVRNHDLVVGLLAALGLYPRDAIPEGGCETLRIAAFEGRVGARNLPAYALPHFVAALGRLGEVADAARLLDLLDDRRVKNVNMKRSATLALGDLAPRLDPAARARALATLTARLQAEMERRTGSGPGRSTPPMDATQASLTAIVLARLAAADLAGAPGLSDAVRAVGSFLRDRVRGPTAQECAYGALALAGLGRAMRAAPDADRLGWIEATAALLREQVADAARPADDRAAFALALGLLGDAASEHALRDLVVDARLDSSLRGAAARGLGLLAPREEASRRAIGAALAERRSEMLQIDAAIGLGLCGEAADAEALLDALRTERGWTARGALVQALGLMGRGAVEQVPALVELLGDEGADDRARALAAAALGLVADPEPAPILARVTAHTNWRTSSDCLAEILDLL
jgi:hypothetical protein